MDGCPKSVCSGTSYDLRVVKGALRAKRRRWEWTADDGGSGSELGCMRALCGTGERKAAWEQDRNRPCGVYSRSRFLAIVSLSLAWKGRWPSAQHAVSAHGRVHPPYTQGNRALAIIICGRSSVIQPYSRDRARRRSPRPPSLPGPTFNLSPHHHHHG